MNTAPDREPRISVVTVALNCVDDAERTARSVLAQSYPHVEYLVKDGGSSDGTPERLHALGVRQIISGPDAGIYAAMNEALAHCSGDYVCFMNAGDRFAAATTLETVAATIVAAGRPQFLYGDIRSLVRHPYLPASDPEAGRPISYPRRLGRFWLYRKMICHQAWFVRRDVYAERPFDTSYRILADYAYLLELILTRRASYAHIPAPVAIFDGGGLSTRPTPQRDEERRRALAATFSPLERRLYALGFHGMRWANRALIYRLVYPLLPERLRGRASGL